MKRKTVLQRAEAWASKEATAVGYKGVNHGYVSALLELAYLAGYRAAKREGRK